MALFVAEDDGAVSQSNANVYFGTFLANKHKSAAGLYDIFLFPAIFQSMAHVQADANDNYFFHDPFEASSHLYVDATLGDTEEADVIDVQTLANASGYTGQILKNNHFLINSKQIPRTLYVQRFRGTLCFGPK
ncbi:hypothetical protein IV203_006481 [Nitzschia inconspicua]|uniref:Uncharacterized protein n=1 Tax=Nitzschia inconspicua TaxID=303405 RepID=A0A9K3PA63_9STRA|nr:hypothetical protein IV203_006653 [Nitzschia inconspicua]KAG7340077.1 hypothetical protein IV203_006481 [Nitzschia inconspicua]